jgi:hypothetical protein
MASRRFPLACLLAAAAGLLAAGCSATPYQHTDVIKQNEQLTRDNRHLAEQLAEANRQIADLARQVRWGHQMTDRQRADLVTVTDIALGRFTGGIDTDGAPGDDGIKIYLQPLDAEGTVLKAVGTLDVQLFDLGIEQADRRIGHWTLTPGELRKAWSSSFLGASFRPVLPFQNGLPAHEHLTCRVAFTDLLTGRGFVKQADFDVKPPPAAPAAAPATEPASRPAP